MTTSGRSFLRTYTEACEPAESLVWQRDGADWPNRETSQFVRAAGLRFHVQRAGRGPVLLLLHGTGSATHSWRALAPQLATHFDVIAPDLPGHGFSEAASGARLTLPGMASALSELLRVLDARPDLVVGHSAGAAIACRMSLDGGIAPRGLVSLNGALRPFGGRAWRWSAPLAQVLASNAILSRVLARRGADPLVAERLIRGTGSRLEPEGLRLYQRLVQNPAHVAATLGMMSHWDLAPLARALPALEPKLLLVVGERDRYIPPSDADATRALLPRAQIVRLPYLGHLAHEERPSEVAALLRWFARSLEITRPEAPEGLQESPSA